MLKRISEAGAPAAIARVVQAANAVVVVLAPLVLIAWAIVPVRDWLRHRAYFDEGTIIGLLGLVISLTLVHFNHLVRRTDQVTQALADLSRSRSGVIANGVTDVYPELLAELRALPVRARQVDVLGLTLFTAWNQLQGFLPQPETRGWTVRLLCICPGFVERELPGIPREWAGESRRQAETIRRFLEKQAASLAERDVKVSLECYAAFPALHGFILGNGTLFMSVTQWEAEQDELAMPYHPYEKIDATDHSRRAHVYREIFRNWVDHARSTATTRLPSGAPAEQATSP